MSARYALRASLVRDHLAARLRSIAEQSGVSAGTLFDLWMQEMAAEETSAKSAT